MMKPACHRFSAKLKPASVAARAIRESGNQGTGEVIVRCEKGKASSSDGSAGIRPEGQSAGGRDGTPEARTARWRPAIVAAAIGLALLPAVAAPALADCGDPPQDGIVWDGCPLVGRDFSNADLSNALMNNTDLSKADLSGSRLSGTTAHGAKFQGANLAGAAFDSADLTGSDFAGADMSGANLANAILTDADLQGADLSDADLQGAILDNANLTDAKLDGAMLGRASLDQTVWSDGSVCSANSFGACGK